MIGFGGHDPGDNELDRSFRHRIGRLCRRAMGLGVRVNLSVREVKKGGSYPARCNEVTLAVKTHLVIVRFGFPAGEEGARLHRWNGQIEVLRREILGNPGRG